VFTNGNPAPGARLWDNVNDAGSATLTQTFNCGGTGDGLCFLSLEYIADTTYGSNMAVTVTLDNVVMYSANHNGGVTAFTPVEFSVPCGQHQHLVILQLDDGRGQRHGILYPAGVRRRQHLEQPQGDLSVGPRDPAAPRFGTHHQGEDARSRLAQEPGARTWRKNLAQEPGARTWRKNLAQEG